MEKTVKVVSCGSLREVTYDNGSKLLKKLEIVLTDGKDTFMCEALNERAEIIAKCPPKDGALVRVDVRIDLRSWDGADGRKQYANGIRLENLYYLS